MAGDTDFLVLFQELGLSAGCRVDELKLAFRRRVSQLHPDRVGDRVPDAESRLQRLTATYNAALDFHRQHGRLPGYAAAARAQQSATQPHEPPAGAGAAAAHPKLPQVSIIIFAVTAALLVWWLLGGPGDDEYAGEASTTPTIPADASRIADISPAQSPAPHRLMLGMSPQDVRAIQGEPLSTGDEHWDYGPSWIAFKCGKVSDWYSSRLGPLRASTPHPSPSDVMPVLRAVDCAQASGP